VFATLQCLWALSLGSRQLLKDGLDWAYDVVECDVRGLPAVLDAFAAAPGGLRATELRVRIRREGPAV
jgi:hypothetical protein